MSPLLEVRSVTRRFGGLVAVDSVAFDVAEKEILSVIGPNGAGKSTLFKLIASFLKTSSGEVISAGKACISRKPATIARMTRMMMPEPVDKPLNTRSPMRFRAR